MGCMLSVFSSDPHLSERDSHPNKQEVVKSSSKVVEGQPQSLDNYMNALKPVKGPKRLKFNPNLPKTLTPKGCAKYESMKVTASKQYETLVKDLKAKKKLWNDHDFPANENSIGNMQDISVQIEWKRPHEIISNAKFFSDGASRFDIEQGELGDCWLLAAVASIADHPHMFSHVVFKNQEFKGPDYVGVIRFRFWQFGEWVEVLIDDRLPVRSGSNELVFMHSSDPTEFWSALLEKAYAKLNGCYAHLTGGTQSEAMEDFTGGICSTILLNPDKRPHDLIEQLKIYTERCCLIGCNIYSQFPFWKEPDNGLVSGHAYSLTGIHCVHYRGKPTWLVRIRNPWGGIHEWKGAWCDGAPEWLEISKQERKDIQLKFAGDGEFWMSFEDFVKNFSVIEACHLALESLDIEHTIRGKRRLNEVIFRGQWKIGVNAGGSDHNTMTYWKNPQFRITVKDADLDDNKCFLLVGVMQKGSRMMYGSNFRTIGFMIYEIPDDQTTLVSGAQMLNKTPIATSQFIKTREVVEQLRVRPGTYLIIPCTSEPHIEGDFLLRVFTTVNISEQELDDNNTNRGLPDDIIKSLKSEDTLLNKNNQIVKKLKDSRDPNALAINATKMGELLNNSSLHDMPSFKGFNKELCRSMVASVDNNLTGHAELNECMDIWEKAMGWKHIFLKHDKDQSGYCNVYELREALNEAGIHVSNLVFNAIVQRFTDPGSIKISFEDFMLCMVRLKTAFETVKAQPKNKDGSLVFTPEDYIRFTVAI
ncbi:Calpain [Schistosoma japonicum]|nr:Calpain [Schistosoma japonicum]